MQENHEFLNRQIESLKQELRASKERFRNIIARNTDGILIVDDDGLILFANPASERLFGRPAGELIGSDFGFPVVLGENTEIQISRSPDIVIAEMRVAETAWEGKHAYVATMSDITNRKHMENNLRRSSDLSAELNRINTLIHSTLDAKEAMASALKGAERVLGVDWSAVGIFERGILKGLSIRYFTNVPEEFKNQCCSPEEAKGILYAAVRRDAFAFNDLSTDERVNNEFWKKYKFGSMLAAPLVIRNEVIGAVMFICAAPSSFDELHVDFTRKLAVSLALAFENARLFEDRGKMENEMRHLAHHDHLTGLPNRLLFLDIIELERKQADRNRKKMAVLFLDIDRFKEVNDTLGHEAGNVLLIDIASRLKSCVRRSDTIARIGGDEFNIILADITRPEDISDIAQNIIDTFRKPFRINSHELNITTSVGISIYPDDGDDLDTLQRYADIAMYHAKEQGKNQFQFYNKSINVKSIERMHLERMLRQSLERGEMEIFYQPIVDIRTHRIISAEALARWNHVEKGLLLPQEFIPAAEETGFINELGEWSLKAVCGQIKTWINAGYRPLRVTVNLSSRQFKDPGLIEKISAILKETEMPPGLLGIEITETIAMSDGERSAARIKSFKKWGLRSPLMISGPVTLHSTISKNYRSSVLK